MPTTANLERLEALRGTLLRIAAVQRGELIRADDWNTVVRTLLDLAQLVLGVDAGGGLPVHEHAEQVSLRWLEPSLRALLEKGPLGDPLATDRLARIERQVSALSARLDGLTDGVGSVRNRLTEVVTRDLVRESDVTSVRHKLEGLADPREDVFALRRSLDTLSTDVRAVNELGARLVVDGEPVDFGALAQRVGAVEGLRDALRQPDGELLSATKLEQRLTELTNTLVTETDLSSALSAHTATIGEVELASLEGRLSSKLGADLTGLVTGVRRDLDASVAQKLGDVDGAASRAVSAALPGLQSAALEAAKTSVAAAIQKSQGETTALLDKRLAETQAATDRALEVQRAELGQSVTASVQGEITRQLPTQLATLTAKIGDLTQTLATTAQRMDATDATIKATQLRIATFEGKVTQTFDDQRLALTAEMARRDDAQTAGIDQKLATRDLASQAALKSALDATRTDILRSVGTSTTAGTTAGSTRVLAEDLRGGVGGTRIERGGLAGGGGIVQP